MPRVLNKYKDAIPPGAVYIGRPSAFGNPIVMDDKGRDRTSVVRDHAEWLASQPELIEKIKTELRGKDLVCFCAPLPCHGDVILKVANEE